MFTVASEQFKIINPYFDFSIEICYIFEFSWLSSIFPVNRYPYWGIKKHLKAFSAFLEHFESSLN